MPYVIKILGRKLEIDFYGEMSAEPMHTPIWKNQAYVVPQAVQASRL